MTEPLNAMSLEREPKIDTHHDESTFSAASMFGMLLTLTTCLLLQPKGSLIFRRPYSVLGRALFFFLRLNPMECAIEAATVLHALLFILWRAIRSCHGNPYREFGVFTADLQAGAAGLLFLRSHTALRPLPEDPRLDERLEGQAPTRGHAAMVIDIITLLSVAVTAVKLAASVVPCYFQIITWCYVVGWVMVQLTVMMSHYGPSKEQLDPEALLRSAEYLQQKVDVLELCRYWGRLALMLLMAAGFIGSDKSSVMYCFPLMFPLANYGLIVKLSEPHMDNLSRKRMEPVTIFVLLVSLLVTIAILATNLVWYEEEGTFKPEWLDWLG